MPSLPSNTGKIIAVRCSALEAEFAMTSCLNKKERELIGVGSMNGPESIVIYGSGNVVEKVMKFLVTGSHSLQVCHAFHLQAR